MGADNLAQMVARGLLLLWASGWLGCAAGTTEAAARPVGSASTIHTVALAPETTASSSSAALPPTSAGAGPTLPALTALPTLPRPFACESINRAVESVAEASGANVLTAGRDALFWTDGDAVRRVTPSGDTKTIVPAARGAAPIVDLVALEEDLFVVRRRDDAFCTGSVERFDAADGGRREVVGQRCVDRLAVSATHVAWIGRERSGGFEETRISVKGRAPGATTQVLTRSASTMAGIALTEDQLVVALSAGRVEAAPLVHVDRLALVTGTAPVRFSFLSWDQRLLAVDGTHAYFFGSGTKQGGLRVFRAPLAGQNTETIGSFVDVERPGGPSRTWAASPTHLHFTLPAAGLVFRADKSGRCSVERLASERARPESPAVVGDDLFWLELSAKPIFIARMKL